MWPTIRDQKLFAALIAGLIALAWLSLWAWTQSPYGRFLSHEELGGVDGGAAGYLVLVSVFVAGWTLMTMAMMLPTSLPLVALFHTFVRRRPDQLRLVGLLVVGYLGIWTVFAVIVHVSDVGIHEIVERNGWLEENEWMIGAATLTLAGLYQFTPLKYHCLDKCRSPLSFVMEHWRGRRERLQAFWLGIHHGLYCLGCCWSLMLVMFAVGVGNLGWMLALGAVMAVEKNMPWGRRLSAPLGALLLAGGLALAFAARGGGAL